MQRMDVRLRTAPRFCGQRRVCLAVFVATSAATQWVVFVAANVATCGVFVVAASAAACSGRFCSGERRNTSAVFEAANAAACAVLWSRTPRIAANDATCDGLLAARAAFREATIERRAHRFVDAEEARAAKSRLILP